MDQDTLLIASAALSAEVSTLGAELQTLRDADGRDLLWDGDPAFWTGRAPLLFPVVGELAGGAYRFDGREYAMPKHGFARRSAFTVVASTADRVTLRLEASDATRAVYPFAFRLDATYAVQGATLSLSATVSNLGDADMPASFGFHPAFRWPLPYGQPRAEHRITFAEPEPAPIRRIDAGGLLTPVGHPTPVQGRELRLRDALFEDDALIFDRLRSRSLTYGSDEGPKLTVAFPAMPLLGVWTKPGAGFICIEPWQGWADPEGFAGDVRDKPGIVTFAAGETRTFAMTVTLAG